MKPDENLNQVMAFYCELMQEIKIRDQGIADLTNSKIPAQIAYESSYLQLRLICELIAIACLVIHGDIPAASQKMKSTWEADRIIKRLSEIHSDFYPHPVNASRENKFELKDVAEPFLGKTDLILLYGKCGDRLHRGTVKNARHRISPNNVSFARIEGWRMKMVNLLQHHWIKLHDSNDQIGVQMNELSKSPSWNYWAWIAPPSPSSQS